MRQRPHTDVIVRLKQAADAKIAANPALLRRLALGGGAALAGTGLGAALMHSHDAQVDAQDNTRAKNTSFGAGVAAGLAGPHIISALDHRLNPHLFEQAPAPTFIPPSMVPPDEAPNE